MNVMKFHVSRFKNCLCLIVINLLLLLACSENPGGNREVESAASDGIPVDMECYECLEVLYVLGSTAANVHELSVNVRALSKSKLRARDFHLSADGLNTLGHFMRQRFNLLQHNVWTVNFSLSSGYRRGARPRGSLWHNGITYQDGKHQVAYVVQYRNSAGGVINNRVMGDEELMTLGFKFLTPDYLLPLGDFVDVEIEGAENIRAVIWRYVYSANINHHFTLELKDDHRVLASENFVSCMETWFIYKFSPGVQIL